MKTILVFTLVVAIHSWYPNECCSDNDCYPVPCDGFIKDGPFVIFRPTGDKFRQNEVKGSQDSNCHICVGIYETRRVPRCAFIAGTS